MAHRQPLERETVNQEQRDYGMRVIGRLDVVQWLAIAVMFLAIGFGVGFQTGKISQEVSAAEIVEVTE